MLPLLARSARLGVGQALLAAEAVPALRKQGHGRDVQARGAAKQAASLYRVGKVDLVHRVESKPSAVVQRAPPQEPRGLRTVKVGPVVLVERVPLEWRNSRWPAGEKRARFIIRRAEQCAWATSSQQGPLTARHKAHLPSTSDVLPIGSACTSCKQGLAFTLMLQVRIEGAFSHEQAQHVDVRIVVGSPLSERASAVPVGSRAMRLAPGPHHCVLQNSRTILLARRFVANLWLWII